MIYDINGNVVVSTELFKNINIEYNRANSTSYVFIRIPKKTNEGKTITPKIALTSDTYNGQKLSTLEWAIAHNQNALVVNAGLFDGTSAIPVGVTIINGTGIQNVTPSVSGVSKYPLCIDDNGDFCAPYLDCQLTNAEVISDGYDNAVTGWGTPIVDYDIADSATFYEPTHDNEAIPQQVIGQFQNGDYFIMTSDGNRGSIANETGMTYAQISTILKNKGVKFAYALDGGGSAETVTGVRQVNPIYENTKGRPVATVIYFSEE